MVRQLLIHPTDESPDGNYVRMNLGTEVQLNEREWYRAGCHSTASPVPPVISTTRTGTPSITAKGTVAGTLIPQQLFGLLFQVFQVESCWKCGRHRCPLSENACCLR